MAIYLTLEEHEANPPETWSIVKVADRCWHVVDARGAVLQSEKTRRACLDQVECGWLATAYAKEGRWMRGETPPGHRSYAECLAERERTAARWASRLTDDDRDKMTDVIGETLRRWRFERGSAFFMDANDCSELQNACYRSIGCDWRDLRRSEIDEIAARVIEACETGR
jgi:uncharacterized protein YbdZ (MbtH family)